MQNWFSEKQEENNLLEKIGISIVAGGLAAFIAPIILVVFTFVWALIFYIGFSLMYPWLVELAPSIPKMNFWSAWGFVLAIRGIIAALRYRYNSGGS